jgi:hypothetical protein
MGKMLAASLGDNALNRAPETVLGHAANLIALYGWGRLHLERWGDALCLSVDELPPLDEDNLAVAALLGGLFSTLSEQEVACVPIGDSNRYLMVDPQIAEYVWSWSKEGESLRSPQPSAQPRDINGLDFTPFMDFHHGNSCGPRRLGQQHHGIPMRNDPDLVPLDLVLAPTLTIGRRGRQPFRHAHLGGFAPGGPLPSAEFHFVGVVVTVDPL